MYKNDCRSRDVDNYQTERRQEINNIRKRQHEESTNDEEETDDYRLFLHQQSRQIIATPNEFDRYFMTPPPTKKIKTLEYWKEYVQDFLRPNLMARDTCNWSWS